MGFAGAEETYPFSPDATVFKVRGKIFAIAHLGGEPPSISLKCEPGLALQLRAEHPAITPGYHLNKRHWNTVKVDGSLPSRSRASSSVATDVPMSWATSTISDASSRATTASTRSAWSISE